MGLFDNFKKGLKKTGDLLKTDIRDLFKSEGRLVDEEFLEDIRAILFKTDMGYDSVEALVAEIAQQFRARVVHREDLVGALKVKLKELMAQPESPIEFADSGPTVVMVCGVNGAGKTTSIAKLTHLFKSHGKSVILGAGDTFRAAAVEQLTIWADRLGAQIVTGEPQSHPASVAYRAAEQAAKDGIDVCIVDTAGRLQTQRNLMDELTKIRQSIGKPVPGAPHETLLVLDATTGQNGISQANSFAEAAGCTGLVLAKLDGTAKGGVVVAIRQQLGLPVKYIGVGEKHEDLAPFVPDEFVEALFADVMSADA
ncbi:Signal recognition particle receptor FtsY [Posidoniimonas polymericola]|uniref:Signal recognition particle receptor FtsY n=1 Tax=Posidoniimonas polymericola TaxID=2528002 RepID=A0A5C5YMF1_9BACT|nr:signal recognition particle-docking protein FtsY [Posidoniimonas polymericola]TWT76009.1 Signal recognition particle receptor FtsY [Posidoniimonas polymericola]